MRSAGLPRRQPLDRLRDQHVGQGSAVSTRFCNEKGSLASSVYSLRRSYCKKTRSLRVMNDDIVRVFAID